MTTNDITNITAISATSGGIVTDDGGLDVTVCGLCWSTSPNPTIDPIEIYDFENSQIPITWVNDSIFPWIVSSDTPTSNYCIKSGNSGVAGSSSAIEITREFDEIGSICFDALCMGEGSSYDKCIFSIDGVQQFSYGANVQGWKRYIFPVTAGTHTFKWSYTKDGSVNPTGDAFFIDNIAFISNGVKTVIGGTTNFSGSITCLSLSTTYYVRAYATTAAGTAYGEEKTFTTRDGIPTVTTAEVTDIQGETATCGGNVTDKCGLTVIARGVCWGTSPNPTLDDSHTTNGSGMGNFSSSITGLTISTTYYVRAYATTSAGTGYGEQVSFTTRNGIPTLTTAEVTNIGSACAYSGGNITDDGGLAIIARGVCWSTSLSPTLADSHTTNDNGVGSFTSFINGLSTSTTYYVRAYATNSFVTVYGNQLCFTTTNDDHEYVDLGLPSGLLWATYSVGAETPEDYGDYFAWGETQPKDYYDFSTYQYCNGSYNTLTKYCNNFSYGYNGFTDNLTTLLPEDDAATANWGGDWRMPTKEELQELYNNTTNTWTQQNGVNGVLFTASNGNSLFLPAAGNRWDGELNNAGSNGNYWSSSLNTDNPNNAWNLNFNSGNYYVTDYYRYRGRSVRGVRSSRQN